MSKFSIFLYFIDIKKNRKTAGRVADKEQKSWLLNIYLNKGKFTFVLVISEQYNEQLKLLFEFLVRTNPKRCPCLLFSPSAFVQFSNLILYCVFLRLQAHLNAY